MYCNKTICQNTDNKKKNICCHNCSIKCSVACEENHLECKFFVSKKENLYSNNQDFKSLIKKKLEYKSIHQITYNNTDQNEIKIECIGGSTLTIIPTIIDGTARLNLELKYIDGKEGIL